MGSWYHTGLRELYRRTLISLPLRILIMQKLVLFPPILYWMLWIPGITVKKPCLCTQEFATHGVGIKGGMGNEEMGIEEWKRGMEMEEWNHGLKTHLCSILLPFHGCLCTFFGLSVSGNSSLSHSPVEIQQYLCAFHIYNSILLICQQQLFLKHEWWK